MASILAKLSPDLSLRAIRKFLLSQNRNLHILGAPLQGRVFCYEFGKENLTCHKCHARLKELLSYVGLL
jgi:hypothetical protein